VGLEAGGKEVEKLTFSKVGERMLGCGKKTITEG